MMPFVMETSFGKCKLPKYLKSYWDEIINKDYYFQTTTLKLITENQYGNIGKKGMYFKTFFRLLCIRGWGWLVDWLLYILEVVC